MGFRPADPIGGEQGELEYQTYPPSLIFQFPFLSGT